MGGTHLCSYLYVLLDKDCLSWSVLWKLVVSLHSEFHPLIVKVMEQDSFLEFTWPSYLVVYNFCLRRIVPIGMWNLLLSTCVYYLYILNMFIFFTFLPS